VFVYSESADLSWKVTGFDGFLFVSREYMRQECRWIDSVGYAMVAMEKNFDRLTGQRDKPFVFDYSPLMQEKFYFLRQAVVCFDR
jgi:hypothetical protein